MYKKIIIILAVVICIGVGCSVQNLEGEKIKDLDFTVLADENVPEELLEVINQKKSEVFNMTFSDAESTYIVVGYGSQPSGGYTIVVDELYETEDSIYLATSFNGPDGSDAQKMVESCPYMVLKIEYNEKPVIYN